MSESNQGGQAFPSHPCLYSTEDQAEAQGMSLRDYFAGQAMVSRLGRALPYDGRFDLVAEEAYKIAEAMLRARASLQPEQQP